MRIVCLASAFIIATALGAAEPKPFGIDKRVPWTTSRVVGSPDPPLAYQVTPAFPKLKVPFAIGVAREPGTSRLLLISQTNSYGPGRIWRIQDNPLVSLSEELLHGESTYYGVAFHPDFQKNGQLYVGSNGPSSSGKKTTRVTRYTLSRQPPFALDLKSEKIIIEWDSDGHNGGDVAFGPDGMLYVTSGDGTSDSDANITGQDLSRPLAKLLRIDVDHPAPGKAYAVPSDNPFVTTPAARPETWAYGFRNPWRLHIDQPTGDIWVGNNGQDLWEQVYLVARGANYGWSVLEGTHPFYLQRQAGPTPFSRPIADHPHSEMRSLTGGIVYHGSRLPELRGAYIYGDYSTGKIWGLRHQAGKVTWHKLLADTTLQITGFGSDSHDELLIADHGGGYYRLEPAPARNSLPFPTRLSETGLFLSVKDHRPNPGLIPYSVIAPLWSDGAEKERFIALPGTETIDLTSAHGWNFPEGTVLVKTFSLPTRAKSTTGLQRVETRLLTKQVGKWVGYSYLWNPEQTDAVLVPSEGLDRPYEVRDAKEPAGSRRQTWHFPSRTECMVCHSRAANFVLGLSTVQMNKVHQYGTVADNQLRTLEHLGVLHFSPEDHIEKSPRLVNPYDRRESVEARARSYLHANCAQCHINAGGGNAMIDLDFTTTTANTKTVGVRPLHDSYGMADAKLIAPADPARSVLLRRLALRGPGQMPPLATSLVDEEAVQLLRVWIEGMK